MDITDNGLKSIRNAIQQIGLFGVKRVDLGHNTIVYKVPTGNPNKYTIRIDIKVDDTEENERQNRI